MRKKIVLILAFILLTFNLVGCTELQKEFYGNIKKTSQWEYTEVEQDSKIEMDIMGEKVGITFDMTGYSDNTNLNAYIKMNMKMDIPQNPIDISNIEIYLIDGKYYISKNYFMLVAANIGQEAVTKLNDITGDFIALTELDEQLQSVYSLLGIDGDKQFEKMYEEYEVLAKAMGLDIPVQKNGSTYEIELKGEQMADLLVKLIKVGETLVKQEDIQIANLISEVDYKEIQEIFKNSKLTYALTPDKDSYKQSIKMNLDLQDEVKMILTSDTTSKKAVKKEIGVPAKVSNIGMEELMTLLTPKVVWISPKDGIMQDGLGNSMNISVITEGETEIYLPARAVLTALGEEVIYNKETKQVGILKDDIIVPIQVANVKGTSYISLEALEKLGCTVQHDVDNEVIVVMK